jgi:hypothetical protein
MRAPALSLLVLGCALAQDSRPASRPAALDSDIVLRELAVVVMPARITKRVEELRGLQPVSAAEVAAVSSAAPGGRRILLAARASDASGVSALLEAARVLRVCREGGDFADLGFEVCFEITGDQPESRPPGKAFLAEIRVERSEEPGPAISATVRVPESRKAVASRIQKMLGRFKGERGFWADFEVVADPSPVAKDAPVQVTLKARAGKDARPDSRGGAPDSRGAARDAECRAAVRAARCALMIVAHLAEELRGR